MKQSSIISIPSFSGCLLASTIYRPGRNEISILPLNKTYEAFKSTIEFQQDEFIKSITWLKATEKNGDAKTKKRSRSNDHNRESSSHFNENLAILLTTGEILIYSPLTKDFSNKISNDFKLSCISYVKDNQSYDLIAFDSVNSQLKFYSSKSSQIINSIPFKADSHINYITTNNESNELVLASNNSIYILDSGNEIKKTIDLSNERSNSNDKITKILNFKSFLAIIRLNSDKIEIISESDKSFFLSCSNFINDISIFIDNKKTILSSVLNDGSIELFINPSNSKSNKSNNNLPSSRLVIDGNYSGNDIGKFIGLIFDDSIYKGIWFDNFNIKFIDFEFEDISKLKGDIAISVITETFDDNEIEDEQDGESLLKSNIDSDNQSDVEEIDDTEYKKLDPIEIYDLIKQNLEIENDNETETDNLLIKILTQNVEFSKKVIYLLTIKESLNLFKKLSLFVSNYSINNSNNNELKIWLKGLILNRGNVLSKDVDCTDWLKLLKSNLNQDVKLMNNLLKLSGKLSLLKDQLTLRQEILQKNADYEDHIENENENDIVRVEESVVLDGEGGNYEDDDDVEDEVEVNCDDDDEDDDDEEDEDD